MRNENTIRVTNIQRMCFHDGVGIRTTVFLKGCSIHCPWCSNPENIRFDMEQYELQGKTGVYGRDFTADELFEEVCKDRTFWGKDGGVTFSGGEALMQSEALIKLLHMLKADGIHIVVETALFVQRNMLEMVQDDIDGFLVDVKILDNKLCKTVLGGDIDLYKSNVEYLYGKGKIKLFRVPLCHEYTYTEQNKLELIAFLRKYAEVPVQIFAVHGLGVSKYHSLGKTMMKTKKIDIMELDRFCAEMNGKGIMAEVIEI